MHESEARRRDAIDLIARVARTIEEIHVRLIQTMLNPKEIHSCAMPEAGVMLGLDREPKTPTLLVLVNELEMKVHGRNDGSAGHALGLPPAFQAPWRSSARQRQPIHEPRRMYAQAHKCGHEEP